MTFFFTLLLSRKNKDDFLNFTDILLSYVNYFVILDIKMYVRGAMFFFKRYCGSSKENELLKVKLVCMG